MIKYISGNIFESKTECLVNTVNCEGYMGKGIAYQFKLRFPENNKDYVRACKNGELKIGKIHSFIEDGTIIVNFPTKNKWREKSDISYIYIGLDLLTSFIKEKSIKSISIPPLGCGNGGLIWEDVRKILEDKLYEVSNDCDIMIYEPSKTYTAVAKEAPKLTVSSLVLLQIKMRLDKWDSLRLQKTCFFVNYFSKDDYFKFEKFKYGPYSHSIEIVAKGIKEYQSYYNLKNVDDVYAQAYQVLVSSRTNKKLDTLLPAIEKATKYVNSINSNKKLEGIATVLFLIQKNPELNEERVIELFKKWSLDKAERFSEQEIIESISYLEDSGIIIKNLLGSYTIY